MQPSLPKVLAQQELWFAFGMTVLQVALSLFFRVLMRFLL